MSLMAYKLEGDDEALILVESAVPDGIPRSASAEGAIVAAVELSKSLRPVQLLCQELLDALKAAQPSKVVVDFGIEMGGKFGIPIVSAASAKTNFKIQLTWEMDDAAKAG